MDRPEGRHDPSSGASALLGSLLMPLVLAGVYLVGSSRAVRGARSRRRTELRRAFRRRSALALLVVVAVTVPATLLARTLLPT